MRRRTAALVALCTVTVAACGRGGERAAATDTAAAAAAPGAEPAPAAPAAALTAADLAGTWEMRATPETGDTTPTAYRLTATNTTTGWSMQFPDGPKVDVRPTFGGDSLVIEAGPYASVRRKGVQVTTRSVLRREGDRMVGRTVARYRTTGPDTMLVLRSEGTRAP